MVIFVDYIDEIFTRLDFQNIRKFLLHGVGETIINLKSYKERIDETEKPAIEVIRSKFPNEEEYEKIKDKVLNYAITCEEVYREICMQCGAVLVMQLLGKG